MARLPQEMKFNFPLIMQIMSLAMEKRELFMGNVMATHILYIG